MTIIYNEDELLLLSGIQHFYYCQRQWALIHVEQQWEENVSTFQGRELHERADNPFIKEARKDIYISRSVPIVSHTLGLYGITDVVEYRLNDSGIPLRGKKGLWMPRPVEYKRGKEKSNQVDEVQLCAQAMCIEEMCDVEISEADLFYFRTKKRVKIVLDEDLRAEVKRICMQMHKIFKSKITPGTPKKQTNCRTCSLFDICMPRLTGKKRNISNYINYYLEEEREDQEIT